MTIKMTGKRRAALRKIENRALRAATAWQLAATPLQADIADAQGLKAARAHQNLRAALRVKGR